MKRAMALAALAAFIVSAGSVAAAGPIENLVVVQDFPETIVAGSGYQAHYRFGNSADGTVSLAFMLNFSNSEYPVNYGEVFVSMELNDEGLSCGEEGPGSFFCDSGGEEAEVGPGSTNDLLVNISSVPPLFPDDNYTITLDFVTSSPPAPSVDIPFAVGNGQASDGGKRISGNAVIYTDEDGENFRLQVNGRRPRREFSRAYGLVRHYSFGFWEVYQLRDDSGRNFSITVLFRSWVYGHGRNIVFIGRLA